MTRLVGTVWLFFISAFTSNLAAHVAQRARAQMSFALALTLLLAAPGVARADVGAYVYVPSMGGGDLTIINAATRSLVQTVPFGTPGLLTAVVSPLGDRVYVVDSDSNVVTIVHATTFSVLGTITLPASSFPRGLAVTPDGQKAYVANQGTGTVSVIDLSTNLITDTLSDASLSAPFQIAINSAGTKAYVTSSSDNLVVVDLATDTIASSIAVGADTEKIVLTPDGTMAWVMTAANDVRRIDLDAETVLSPIVLASLDLFSLAITPDGSKVLVSNGSSIESFDAQTGIAAGSVSAFGGTLAVTRDGRHVVLVTPGPVQTLVRVLELNPLNLLPGMISTSRLAYADGSADFIGPNMILAAGGPVEIGSDADFTAAHLGDVVPFEENGTMHLTGDLTTNRVFAMFGNGFLDDQGFDATLSSNIISPGTLTKSGSGTLTLTGAASHGGTTLNGGTLVLNGAHVPVVQVNAGTLAGIGPLGMVTSSGGAIAPGENGPGIFQASGFMLSSSTTVTIDLAGTTAGTGYDQLAGASTLNGATLQVVPQPAFAPPPGTQFLIAMDATGTFNGLNERDLIIAGTLPLRISYVGGDGNDVVLTVDAPPVVTPLAADTIPEDHGLYTVGVTLADDFTAPATLTLTATSSNTALVPMGGLNVVGTGASRTLQVMPLPDQSGTTTVTVRAFDGLAYAEQSFVLTVTEVNDAPAITPIAQQTTFEDLAMAAVPLTIADVDHAPETLTVTAWSSDQTLVPDANIVLTGSGALRQIALMPAATRFGTALITVRVSDGTDFAVESFQVTVTAVNDTPTVTAIAAQSITEDSSLSPVAFTVDDVDDDVADLTVTATSSNQVLLPDANITLAGSGAARTIAATPLPGAGVTTITVTVDDGTASTMTTFVLTVAAGEISYYLAEGATGPFFDTDLLIANPNAEPAPVRITFLKDDGTPVVDTRTLPATSRTTIHVEDLAGLDAATFSMVVVSTEALPLAVERTMRWDASGYGAHTEKATAGVAPTWYFAEGAQGFFSTFLLLANPSSASNTAHVSWFREGEAPLERSYPLAPGSRTTIDASRHAELLDHAFGARVTFDEPGMAERAMYFGSDPTWLGGHAASGATALSTHWYLAEGATGTYFTTFVLLANPNPVPAEVTLTYYPDGGTPVTLTDTIPAGRRMTRNIALEHPSLANASVATEVVSSQSLVVERTQYWGESGWIESHNSLGVTAPAQRWALAEGRVGGDDRAQTFILLANTGQQDAATTLTFLRTDGRTVVKDVNVPARSRVTIGVTGPDSVVPELADESFGTLIEATQPIVVERSLYGNANGVMWAAGTNATATALPQPR